MYGKYKSRCVTYLTEKQKERLNLLIEDAEDTEASYIREIIGQYLDRNENLINKLQNERANQKAKVFI